MNKNFFIDWFKTKDKDMCSAYCNWLNFFTEKKHLSPNDVMFLNMMTISSDQIKKFIIKHKIPYIRLKDDILVDKYYLKQLIMTKGKKSVIDMLINLPDVVDAFDSQVIQKRMENLKSSVEITV